MAPPLVLSGKDFCTILHDAELNTVVDILKDAVNGGRSLHRVQFALALRFHGNAHAHAKHGNKLLGVYNLALCYG